MKLAAPVEVVSIGPQGNRIVRVIIAADTLPAILPVDGSNVEGLSAKDTFAPMSMLYVVNNSPNKVYLADESGKFVAQ
ncbi:MAG: hypothetical protein ACI4F7_07740 [Acutalibacteraceae bacterium]